MTAPGGGWQTEDGSTGGTRSPEVTGGTELADLCLGVGVNLQPGQELVVSAPLEASPFVLDLAKSAYRRGGRLVTCLYEDPLALRERLAHAGEPSLDAAPEWLHRGVAEALAAGGARLYVAAPYPDLLAGIPAERTVRAHAALARAARAEAELTSAARVNWSTVPFVTDSWARTVFPDLPPEDARAELSRRVRAALRLDRPDPVGAWRDHTRSLDARRDFLQTRRFSALRFRDHGTDLSVGLVEGHRWVGGTVVAANGVPCVCNLPTEEVFTCPHRDRVDGHVSFSRPLYLAGTLVDGLRVEFRGGAVFAASAREGRETFERLVAADEGAGRLGEIALVPHSSPISGSGVRFCSALLDENAASHLAFGQAIGASLPRDTVSSAPSGTAGANRSSIHVDCMFGTASMDVDGVSHEGTVEPVMRGGEFVFRA